MSTSDYGITKGETPYGRYSSIIKRLEEGEVLVSLPADHEFVKILALHMKARRESVDRGYRAVTFVSVLKELMGGAR